MTKFTIKMGDPIIVVKEYIIKVTNHTIGDVSYLAEEDIISFMEKCLTRPELMSRSPKDWIDWIKAKGIDGQEIGLTWKYKITAEYIGK